MICKVTYEVVEDKYNPTKEPQFWIIKSLSIFKKKLFSERLGYFFDVKDGKVPFMNREEAAHRARLMRMMEEENLCSYITDKYFIGSDMEGQSTDYYVYKNTFILGFNLSLTEMGSFEKYSDAVELLNELLDRKHIRLT